MPIDRQKYFDAIRKAPFPGSLNQDQVDGNNAILEYWETMWELAPPIDLRHLAYILATTKHETASTMQPIEEYGKGSGKNYGKPDPETKQTYYGRGYVQLTWRDNYARATQKLALEGEDDLEWHASRALDPDIARQVIFAGMAEGWFTGKYLAQYFSSTKDDPKNARQIVNGNDKDKEIADIHAKFLSALKGAYGKAVPPPEAQVYTVAITIQKGKGVTDKSVTKG